MKKLLISFILMLLPMVASAYDAQIDGIYYNFNTTDKTATVTFLYYNSVNNQSAYSGAVVIPEKVTYNGVTYSVTSIEDFAFWYCRGLTSITIPNSVTFIGDRAFYGCNGLTSVTIPNSVTSIGSGAFYGTGWYNSQPNGILYIDDWLIGYKGDNLTGEIIIKNETKGIADSAFSGCSGLTSVTIPNSVTIIGNSAFSGCSGLPSLTIRNSVTSIGCYAFNGCSGLTSVNIPNSVTSIGNYAFKGCSGLTSVNIPNSVTSIGNSAFLDCSGLTSITIPNSVTSIESAVFSGCSGLTSITIGNSVTSIGSYAFNGCSGLTSVTIPNSVTSIGYGAFWNCSGLTSVTIGNSVTSIGGEAFSGCSDLTSVNISNLDAWCKISFNNYNANPLYYAKHLFIGNEEVTNANIPNSVTSIEGYAFYNCSGLTSVTIPNSVTSIGSNAFGGCTSIMTVKSYIAEPFNISRFSDETYRNGTLYVPAGTKDLYIRFDGWREFLKIEEMEEEDPALPKCDTPSILVQNGKIKFQCNTPDAEFTSTLTSSETFTGSEVVLGNEITYTIKVYATAPGFNKSETATATFTFSKSDLNGDGVIDVGDIMAIINIMAQ